MKGGRGDHVAACCQVLPGAVCFRPTVKFSRLLPAMHHRRSLRGNWLLAAVLASLMLAAQALGGWHGIAHAGHGAGESGVHERAAGAAPGGLRVADIFGHAAGAHGGADCLWFDHLAHADGLADVPALPGLELPPAPLSGVAPAGVAVACAPAVFDARAPPVSLLA